MNVRYETLLKEESVSCRNVSVISKFCNRNDCKFLLNCVLNHQLLGVKIYYFVLVLHKMHFEYLVYMVLFFCFQCNISVLYNRIGL